MDAKKDIVVIGSGLGGLSAAIRLASAGYNVKVFEKNDNPGGKAGEISASGFRFDTGPSLLTMIFVLKQLFTDAGENIDDYLCLEKLNISSRYFWEDGTVINAYSDILKFAQEIDFKTRDTANKVMEYLEYSKTIYDLTADLFIFSPFTGRDLVRAGAVKKLPFIRRIDPFRTMHQANSRFFSDPKTIQLFDRYATYNGSNPYKAPATLNIIQHVEYNLGAYYSKEGMYSVVKAVKKLADKKGVEFYFNSPVKKIITGQNSVHGIVAEISGKDEIVPADVVISNADVLYTYSLLPANGNKKDIRPSKYEPSSSAIVFYWGVKGEYSDMETHNILFSHNYKKEFDDIFTRKILPADPTAYIYISSKFNRNDAPSGCENWFVMVNSPYNTGQDWQKEAAKAKNVLLNKIKHTTGIDLSNNIVYESIMTPEDIEKNTSGSYGSIYGISSNKKSAAFLRQKNRSAIKGLYFCGGSAHPGGGIPLVISSGKIAANLIMKGDVYD